MSPQNSTYAGPTVSRHASGHGTSSAFSSSANPDEDWTKISDLAERRRIQNRIAQRNYRKKLKRRLEDLERRAGSSSASPPQTHVELEHEQAPVEHVQPYKRGGESRHRQPSPRMIQNQYTPPMTNDDELLFSPGFEDREGSQTPPLFTYHTYPAPESVMYPPYPESQAYRPLSTYESRHSYGNYMEPVHLPPMPFHDSIKREEETMTPYNMSYQSLPSIDLHGHHGYDESPLTPPLSHSFEHSTSCSESGYYYPTTPLSMPSSPRLMIQ